MLITKSEFARQIGVSPAAITNAVKSGRLSLADGKRLDAKVAAIQWEANRRRAPKIMPVRQALTEADLDTADLDVCTALESGTTRDLDTAINLWLRLFLTDPVQRKTMTPALGNLLRFVGECAVAAVAGKADD